MGSQITHLHFDQHLPNSEQQKGNNVHGIIKDMSSHGMGQGSLPYISLLKFALIVFVPQHTQQSIAAVIARIFWQSTGSVLKSTVEENCMQSTLCERSVEAV